MNGQADEVVNRLNEVIPEPERADRKFQDGQRVKIVSSGENGDVVEDNWEIVEATGRTEHGDILYSVKSPDGNQTRKIAESHLENMQQAPQGALDNANYQFDQLQNRIDQRFATADQRAGITPEVSEAPTVVVSPGEERESQVGNIVGEPGQMEVRLQDAEGQPHIYRRETGGNWRESRNGDNAHEWFDANPQNVARALGLEVPAATGETPAEPGERPAETPPTPEELRFQAMENRITALEEQIRLLRGELAGRAPAGETPETPGESEEVDAEEMDAALAELDAAMVAMDAGAADYAQARERLQNARARVAGAWNGEQPPASGGGDGNGEQGGAAVVAATEISGGKPENPRQRRERMRKWGRRALGAALVTGGLVGAFFLGKHFGTHPTEIIPGRKSPGEGTRKGIEHAAKFKTEQLSYYGDTIWAHGRATLAQAMGGKLPKDWQVYQWAKETMNLPGNKGHIMNSMGHWRSTWEGARHLPVGFHFRISEAITQAIARGQG